MQPRMGTTQADHDSKNKDDGKDDNRVNEDKNDNERNDGENGKMTPKREQERQQWEANNRQGQQRQGGQRAQAWAWEQRTMEMRLAWMGKQDNEDNGDWDRRTRTTGMMRAMGMTTRATGMTTRATGMTTMGMTRTVSMGMGTGAMDDRDEADANGKSPMPSNLTKTDGAHQLMCPHCS
jgi:hypothetical protein